MKKSTTLLIFGATGDLSHRKLVPALFNLYLKKRLPENFKILGTATRAWTTEDLRETCRQSLLEESEKTFNEKDWDDFSQRMTYQPADFSTPESYGKLNDILLSMESGPANRLYYLATPPDFFSPIVQGLAANKMLIESEGWRRVVIEKPFGSDLASAKGLNHTLHEVLDEKQIFRIDHYLGKETVQNILVARFANTIFEPVWNRNYIESVQITVAETVGVETRGKYYDKAGVVRDMFQNHLLQLLTLVAMEPTSSYKADALRDEKVKVISAIRSVTGSEVERQTVRGQYLGYREEANVDKQSETATYAALRLYIDNWRWQGVPFYLRSGKKLKEKVSEIIIQFKRPPHMIFANSACLDCPSNLLSMRLQPNEGIHVMFEAKVPDTLAETRSVNMDYDYRSAFGPDSLPEAYERLLLDVLNGDASLFTRADQTELSWELIDPILNVWNSTKKPELSMYPPGSWGPIESDRLLASSGHFWLPVYSER